MVVVFVDLGKDIDFDFDLENGVKLDVDEFILLVVSGVVLVFMLLDSLDDVFVVMILVDLDLSLLEDMLVLLVINILEEDEELVFE